MKKAVQENEAVTDMISPAKLIEVGDIIHYHEMRGICPAIVQYIHPDGSLRLWVWGAQSMHPKDGVVEGDEMGYWTRKP